jgi:hypothetical protein
MEIIPSGTNLCNINGTLYLMINMSKAMEFSQEYHIIFFVLPFVIKHIFESLT